MIGMCLCIYIELRINSITYKLQIGGLVVGSVTTGEYPLLYAFLSFRIIFQALWIFNHSGDDE
jgi:hypothetical protein